MAVEAHVPEITAVIQLAVAPVFMLTAVGTILAALSMRLGRAIDRRRMLETRLEDGTVAEAIVIAIHDELDRIARRIRYVYFAIVFAVLAGLFVCLLIASAFFGAFVSVNLSRMIGAMFILAVLALVVCLLFLLREVFIAVGTTRGPPRPAARSGAR